MKTTLFAALLLLLAERARAQDDAISKYFGQYADQPNYTSVYVSQRMFNLFSKLEPDSPEDRELQRTISTLKGLRILSSDKVTDGKKMYQEVIRAMPARGYETLMVVRSEGNDLSFFVVESGDVIRELLLVSGGGRDFFMLSLVGNINLKQISRLSKSLDVQGLEKLDHVNPKPKPKQE